MIARTLLSLSVAVLVCWCTPSVSAQSSDHAAESHVTASVKSESSTVLLDAYGPSPSFHSLLRTHLNPWSSESFDIGSLIATRSEKKVIGNAVDVMKNHQGLVLLTPGTSSSLPAHPPHIAHDTVSVNGQNPRANMMTLDGVSVNFGIAPGGESPGASAAGTSPALTAIGGTNGIVSAEATQEVAIHGYNIEPQYRRVPGGQIDFTSRAGTNQLRGSVFEYFGHDWMDANDWFANNRGLRREKRRLNDFGVTIGGPAKRDSSFFYFSYEGLRLSQPGVLLSDVPAIGARRSAPSELLTFLNAYPVPNGIERSDGFAELASSFSNRASVDAWSTRFDQRVNDNLMLYARYSNAGSSARERGTGGLSANSLGNLRTKSHTFTGSASYIVSPTMVTEARANYSVLSFTSSYLLDDFEGAIVPVTSVDTDFLSRGDSSFRFNLDGRATTLFTASDATHRQRQLNLVGAVSAVADTHTFKVGIDYRRMAPIIGLRSFGADALFDGVEQALTGTVARFSSLERVAGQRPVFNNISVYGQDVWRLQPRFAMTYGARWEVNPAPASGAISVTQAEVISQVSFSGAQRRLWNTTYSNVGPRIGVSAQLVDRSGGELVVRGGFGVFYDLGSEHAGEAYADSVPFLSVATIENSPFSSAVPLLGVPPAGSLPNTGPFAAFDPSIKLPYTMQWNASVQQAIGSHQTFSVAYVRSTGRRLLVTDTHFDSNPHLRFIRRTKNGAKSTYDSMQMQFSRHLNSVIQALVGYTFSKSADDVTNDSAARVLLRSRDPERERGPSDFDTRHALLALASYRLPEPFDYGIGHSLFRKWTVDAVFQARSSRPVNIVYAVPTSYGLAYLRPDAVTGAPFYLTDEAAVGGRRINPAVFSIPPTDVQGSLGRNSVRGFPLHQLDFSLRRMFSFTDRFGLQFRVDVFNLTNHSNFEDPAGSSAILGSRFGDTFRANPTFGISQSMRGKGQTGGPGSSFSSHYSPGGSRTMQLSVRFVF